MAFATVWVSSPKNRLVYINGNYSQPAGNSSTDSFVVPTGGQIFETRNGENQVDFRKRFRVGPRDSEITISLDPVT